MRGQQQKCRCTDCDSSSREKAETLTMEQVTVVGCKYRRGSCGEEQVNSRFVQVGKSDSTELLQWH